MGERRQPRRRPGRPAAEPPPLIAPAEAPAAALDELIGLGYLRGILNKLAEIERLDPARRIRAPCCASWPAISSSTP
jgi:hypothetical protein